MTSHLVAAFEKRFRAGATIAGQLRVPIGGFSVTALFGPSGCGKTTVLRCLAGLERPEQGTVRFGDEIWFDASTKTNRTPQQRNIGFLFQEYALFPHLTVAQNVGYSLLAEPERSGRDRAMDLLKSFGLEGLGSRYPHQISGGQQQRVALARAIARRPSLLLLDEPLSALDAPLRAELRLELRSQLESFALPTILVTHDRDEAHLLADQIVVMDGGQVQQSGPIADVFAQPATISVARSIGIENILPATIMHTSGDVSTLLLGNIQLQTSACGNPGERVVVCIPAVSIVLCGKEVETPHSANSWQVRVASLVHERTSVRVTLDCGTRIVAAIGKRECELLNLHAGGSVFASIAPDAMHVLRSS